MNLNFHIEYQTVYGQDLILNIVSEKKKGVPKVSEYRMQTVDGVHWDCHPHGLARTVDAAVGEHADLLGVIAAVIVAV